MEGTNFEGRKGKMNSEHSSLLSQAVHYLEQAYASEDPDDFQEALEECDAAIDLDPGLAEAHNLRGMILDELGRKEEALAAYREALRLDPSFQEASDNLYDLEDELEEGGVRSPAIEGEGAPIGGSQEVADHVLQGGGLGRVGLNIMCFIGVFIFGWLLAVVFDMLGKRRLGWIYIVPVMVCVAGARLIEPLLAILGLAIYAIGWVHANMVLSNHQSAARDRIAQIDRLPEDQVTVNTVIEKGVLQSNVLADGQAATATLARALQMPGGDAQMLNLAGATLFGKKRYEEAKVFFDRALPAATDEALIKRIKQNQANVEKKLK